MAELTRLAPAKVNLYLHIAAPDAKAYHPLQSLVVFADVGDVVRLLPKSERGGARLSIDGPFADGLSVGEDNLIFKAVRRFEAAAGVVIDRHDIELTKNLPVASGLGGGSADAGAILHLLRDHYAPDMADIDLASVAGSIGADGVMCLWAKAAIAEGYGERLTHVGVSALSAVLINPGIACSTPAVYKAYDQMAVFLPIDAQFPINTTVEGVVEALAATRNDLQPPAVLMHPQIGDIVEALAAQPQSLLARMSGSGATCFALCATIEDAQVLEKTMIDLYPGAWVRACHLC